MLLVVQFPIADGRLFAQSGASRLTHPAWPLTPGVNNEFVRSFGPAARRRGGGDAAWADEGTFCSAGKAIRFPGLQTYRVAAADRQLHPLCAFRRVFSDGKTVVRIEVGLALSHDPRLAPSIPDTLGAVRSALELPTAVKPVTPPPAVKPVTEPPKLRPLIKQGPELAALYGRATTQHGNGSGGSVGNDMVEAGNPVALIETNGFDSAALPHSVHVLDAKRMSGANVAFTWLQTEWGEVPTWILHLGSAEPAQLRSLRLCLLRLHAEQEALDRILKQWDRGLIVFNPGTPLGDQLEEYINRATRAINRAVWSGVDQSAILEAFDAALNVLPDQGRSLLDRYQGARLQVLRKAEEFRKRRDRPRVREVYNVEKGGIIVNADGSGQTFVNSPVAGDAVNIANSTITDSFKRFAAAHPANDDLKAQIALLHDQVGKLTAALASQAPEQSQMVVDNLQTFTEEAAKEKPRAGTLLSTGQAIIEGAKKAAGVVSDVATAVGPITAAVTTVLKLFGIALVL